MGRIDIRQGMSLREAVKVARKLGIEVEQIPASGEYLFKHALGKVRANLRKKDASRSVVGFLRNVEAGQERTNTR